MSPQLAVSGQAAHTPPPDARCELLVTDECGSHRVFGHSGETLLSALQRQGIAIGAVCGGNMICGTCHVLVAARVGDPPPPAGEEESDLLRLSSAYDPQRSRLACQLRLHAGVQELSLVVAPDE